MSEPLPPPLPSKPRPVPLWRASLDPHSEGESTAPIESIGGWLILFSVGSVLSVLVLGYRTFHLWSVYTRPGVWSLFTSPGSAYYHPLWARTLVYELTGSLLRFVGACVLVYLLFTRRKLMRFWTVAFLCLSLAYLWIDHLLAQQIPMLAARDTAQRIGSLTGATLSTFLWAAYFLVSERVKYTFTR